MQLLKSYSSLHNSDFLYILDYGPHLAHGSLNNQFFNPFLNFISYSVQTLERIYYTYPMHQFYSYSWNNNPHLASLQVSLSDFIN